MSYRGFLAGRHIASKRIFPASQKRRITVSHTLLLIPASSLLIDSYHPFRRISALTARFAKSFPTAPTRQSTFFSGFSRSTHAVALPPTKPCSILTFANRQHRRIPTPLEVSPAWRRASERGALRRAHRIASPIRSWPISSKWTFESSREEILETTFFFAYRRRGLLL